jgi:hypothetical protein
MLKVWIILLLTFAACVLAPRAACAQDAATTATAATGVDPDLYIWWKLDETAGSVAADSSGHATHGLLRNGWSWVQGVQDGGLQLDGRSGYAAISGIYYGLANNADVTVCAWIRTTNGGDQIIVSFDRTQYLELAINGPAADAGHIGWSLATNAGVAGLASRARVDDGQWHHVAGVYDRGQVTIYLDGAVDATKRDGTAFGSGTPRFGFVGVGSQATSFDGAKSPLSYFDGALDDVRLYTRALSSQEIQALAARQSSNDDCRNAQAIGEVTNLPFSTKDATNDGPAIVTRSPNIWYRFTAPCSGSVTVSLCGSQYNTMLAVYTGAKCPPTVDTLIAYNDDYCGLQSQLVFDATQGAQYLIEVGGYGQSSGQGVLTVTCKPSVLPELDLGDAPASNVQKRIHMTAYRSGAQGPVEAHFPTLTYQAAGVPIGPIHLRPLEVAHLGRAVSLEADADSGPDEDRVNNLNPATDSADNDGADDGVSMPIAMPQCGWTSFEYIVNVIKPHQDLWVNVWFDFNRDGDWDDDATTCPDLGASGRHITEWAVQNQLLFDPPVGLNRVSTPGFLSWYPKTGPQEIWMRITLSEKPWRGGENPGALGNGGSGPADGYDFGETEDYRFVPQSDCPLCKDMNGDGKLDYADLGELISTWLDECLE